MCPHRPPLPLIALLGLLILIPTGLAGCATSGSKDAPAGPEPAVATEVKDPRDRFATLEAENTDLQHQVADLNRRCDEVKREKDHLANLVEIAKKRGLVWRITEPVLPTIKATVQKVNHELKYVMLSVGTDDKVAKGRRFIVSRNGRYVGEVQVDWVSPKACVASFVQIAPGYMFEVGDTASTRLRDRCAGLEVKNAGLKDELADLTRQHEELKREKDHLANLVKIATDTDRHPVLPRAPAIETTVQKVNRNEKYVMLSAGSDDKVAKGFRFIISRGQRFIGDVQVDYVYPKSSSASFVQVAPGFTFEVGDTASTRL